MKLPISRLSLLVSVILFSFFAGIPDSAWADGAAVTSTQDFRMFYRTVLGAKVPEDTFNHLIFAPDKTLLHGPSNARSASDFLSQLNTAFKKTLPAELYLSGRDQHSPLLPGSAIKSILENLGPSIQDRLTIVILPGFLSELMNTGTFEEAFEGGMGAYEALWNEKLKNAPENLRQDQRYSLKAMDFKDVPLSETIRVSSLDWQTESLVNLVRFDFGPVDSAAGSELEGLSLESVQDTRLVAQIFLRRITKFFKIMGVPKNIAFIGYSRGTPIGLEMLARANEKPSEYPWLKNTKGFVSLGGVVYGSDVADMLFEGMKAATPPKMSQEVMLLSQLADTIQPPNHFSGMDLLTRKQILTGNRKAWMKFILDYRRLVMNAKDVPADLGSEPTDEAVKSGLQKLSEAVTDAKKHDLHSILSIVVKIGINSFSLDPYRFFAEYSRNIYRMKELVNSIIQGAQQLTTDDRLSWWSVNTVPSRGIKYYSIAGTLSDPKRSPVEKEIADCPACFNLNSPDYKGKLDDYRDFRKNTGFSVNDGDVGAHKVRFWPELNAMLNPYQGPLDARFLGTIGTHHYGLALKVIAEMKDPGMDNGIDPYPRKALLKAISTMIARDLMNGN